MRPVFLCVAAFGLSLSSVKASTISMRWVGETGSTIQLAPRETAQIEIWLDIAVNDDLAGIAFQNSPVAQVAQLSFETPLVGWRTGGTGSGAYLGDANQQAAIFTEDLAYLPSYGPMLIGVQTIKLLTGEAGEDIPITFDSTLPHTMNANGSYGGWLPQGASYAGYLCYDGYGSPGNTPSRAVACAGEPTTPNPLIIHVTESSPPDFDRDADVDLVDYAALQRCAGQTATGCAEADLDHNGDIELDDYSLFAERMTSPYIPIEIPAYCEVCGPTDVDGSGECGGAGDFIIVRSSSNWWKDAVDALDPQSDVDGSRHIDCNDLLLIESPLCRSTTCLQCPDD